MTNEPKLLTEAEVRSLWTKPGEEIVAELRERGLTAPEPVDPLLVEARELLAQHYPYIPSYAARVRLGYEDSSAGDITMEMGLVFAALRRGMELQREAAPLTRERVRDAVIAAKPEMLETSDFILRETERCRREAEGFATRLHAALTGAA